MTSNTHARALGVLAALALTATACADDEAPAEGAPPPAPRPALVALETARPGELSDRWSYLGQVRPKHEVTIAAGVSGRVESVVGRIGDRVEAGAEVVVLDTTVVDPRISAAKADVSRIQSDLAQANRELGRAEKLAAPVMTEAERDRYRSAAAALRAQLRAARAVVEQLEAERDRHAIVAPFTATVRARHVEPGGWVTPGMPLVDLVSTDDLEVIVDVAPSLRPHLAPGTVATLAGDPPVEAVVVGVVEALDPKTRTVRVRLEPKQMADWVIPNRPVDVSFALDVSDPAGVVVSRDALVRGPVNVRVIKVVGDQATPIEVTIKATAGVDALVVGEGLAPGDQVVIRGNDRLRPGQPVQVIPR